MTALWLDALTAAGLDARVWRPSDLDAALARLLEPVRWSEPEEARPWLTRELHIVQPKLLVLMGERTVEFLNALSFPLADPVDPTGEGLQRFTSTVEALVVPDIDRALDEAPAKTAFWNAFKAVGAWYAELPPY